MTGLVFGSTGQVARELALLSPELTFIGRDQADLSEPGACRDIIRSSGASFVINAAAYTAVDRAEEEVTLSDQVNAFAPTEMAKAVASIGIPFVHISTDYVFDGAGIEPRTPEDKVSPLNQYGLSKAKGEAGVAASGSTFVILRTSWVFSPFGNNFVKTMLRLAGERDSLNIVSDQVGGATSAYSIAAACLTIVQQLQDFPEKSGIYHFSGTPDMSWAEFAKLIFEYSGQDVSVSAISTDAFPTPAKRPLNSRLDCSLTAEKFGIGQPDVKEELMDVLARLKG